MPQLRQTKLPKTERISPQPAEERQEQPEAPKPIRVTALIVSYNRAGMLRRAIEFLERSEERDKLEILVVDNGSTDGSAQLESEFPNARFIRIPRNFGLTKALNIGVRSVTSEFVLILHEDTEVSPDTARVLASILEDQADVGIACPLLVTTDGAPGPQVAELPRPGRTEIAWRPGVPTDGEQPVEYARGAALMVRKFFLTAMRQIDERYGTYGSDAELCFQALRSGKRVLLTPSTRVLHHGRSDLDSRARAARDADFKLGMAVYLRKRYGIVRGLLFRIGAVIGAFGGMLNFRDFRYHLALFGALWVGQKTDGTQRQ
ncbi:MAG TPA: glycosyltransferase [Bryobacteraceae bacterium]|nr:glycosyltransferase [Bryobacteraceae bacterium]